MVADFGTRRPEFVDHRAENDDHPGWMEPGAVVDSGRHADPRPVTTKLCQEASAASFAASAASTTASAAASTESAAASVAPLALFLAVVAASLAEAAAFFAASAAFSASALMSSRRNAATAAATAATSASSTIIFFIWTFSLSMSETLCVRRCTSEWKVSADQPTDNCRRSLSELATAIVFSSSTTVQSRW